MSNERTPQTPFDNEQIDKPESFEVAEDSAQKETEPTPPEKEARHESEQERLTKLEIVREKITANSPVINKERRIFSDREKEEYIAQHLPEHLQSSEPSLLYRLEHTVGKLGLSEISGKEALPDGPKLFIANHRGGETSKLIGALDEPVHIASAEIINWKGSRVLSWVMKKLGMVPIRESFSNIPEEQRDEVVAKASKRERRAHAEVVSETTNPKMGSNVENVRAMVALLLRGENVAIFAEGPFSRLDNDERRAYAGYALVAREYKKVTGTDLPIIPTGIRARKVSFGESFTIDNDGKETKTMLEDKATEKIHTLYDSLGK